MPAEEPPGGCGRCVQNDLITCDAEGNEVRTSCGALRCAADSPTPQCVPATALPCDPNDAPEPSCENGRTLACDPGAGYLLATPCPAGSVCVGDSAACEPATDLRCTADWNPICVAGERFICVDRQVTVERASCE